MNRSWRGLFTFPLLSLCSLSVLQLSCGCLLLVLWKTPPILISASHFHRNQRTPTLHRATHTYTACVCVFVPVCARAHAPLHACFYVYLIACVCVYTGKEGGLWATDIAHPRLFVYNMSALVLVACSHHTFLQQHDRPCDTSMFTPLACFLDWKWWAPLWAPVPIFLIKQSHRLHL